MRLLSTIRPAPLPDGPYIVVTEANGAITNATLGIGPAGLSGVANAIDQAKADQNAALVGNLTSLTIITLTDG